LIDHLVSLNLTWSLRAGNLDSQDQEKVDKYQLFYKTNLTQTLGLIRSLLTRINFRYLTVSAAGINASSGVFRLVGNEIGNRIASYASGFGSILISTNGIAAHQPDIPAAFKELLEYDKEILQQAILFAKQDFQLRIEGADKAQYQVISSSKVHQNLAAEVLIPLNIEYDAAALGMHYLFNDAIEWLLETIEFILHNSNRIVVVRQHPAERHAYCKSDLDIGDILSKRFGNHDCFHFISAEEKINTYDLLNSASIVLPFVSTVGVEAAGLGKTVLISGNSYYSDLGFVWSAQSKKEYFNLLLKGLKGDLPFFPDQEKKAWLCYYLTQVCNRVWTVFTPQSSDFKKWCNLEPIDLFKSPEVRDILKSIDKNIPLALIRHQRNLEEGIFLS